jgi:hypothetical protein
VHWIHVATVQLGITAATVLNEPSARYFWQAVNPRALSVLLFSTIGDGVASTMSALIAAAFVAIGLTLVRRRDSAALFGYVCAEGLLAVPAAFFFGAVWFVNLSPSHGLSRQEVAVPAVICAVTNLAPWLGAVWLWRRTA